MSELAPKFENGQEKQIDSREFKKLKERAAEQRERAAEKAEARQDSIEVIKDRLEKAAQNSEKIKVHQETPASEPVPHAGTHLKSHALNLTIKRTQKKLPAHDRAFSKFIHQPSVEAVSDVGAATVARPSGLLVGGLFSVISSVVILYICRRYGYEYNFLVGIASFGGGFALGLLLEGFFKLVKR